MGKVIATCTSEIKGVQKKNVHQVCLIEDYGIEGDAHAGKWHRQVSLLSYDRIQEFRARGAKVEDGAFGENPVVEGIDFKTLPIGTKFKCNDVVLELTQIGKECHHGCADLPGDGRLYHAARGRIYKGAARRRDQRGEIIWRFWKKRRKEIKERWETNESSNYYIQ